MGKTLSTTQKDHRLLLGLVLIGISLVVGLVIVDELRRQDELHECLGPAPTLYTIRDCTGSA
jgi:hypothetical protein